MKEYDAAIIGAGPVGCFIAKKLAKEKYNITVFEKNKEIGLPMSCAGLVSSRVFENFGISKKGLIQNKIKGAHIHSPSGNKLSIGGDRTYALVIDRTHFDQKIAEDAKKNGANFFLDKKATKFSRKKQGIELETSENKKYFTKLLIGADGPFSTVRRTFEMQEPKEFLYSAGAELSGTNLDPNFVHIFVGNKVAPGFFAWIIPTNNEGSFARAGLCVDKKSQQSAKYYFKKLFNNKKSSNFLKHAKIEKRLGGAIPLGIIKKNVLDNVMLVGDAAAQVKPTSGGGVFPGLSCADFCSNVAIDAINNNNFSEKFLKEYQRTCVGYIGKEITKGYRYRSIFRSLSDKKLDKYLTNFSNPDIVETINEYGDIDFPSKLVKPMIKKAPLLLKFVLKSLK